MVDVDEAARDDLLRHVKTVVLDQVLRYQTLDEPLGKAIERCLDDPGAIRTYVDWP